jgi:diadenosine tetraphosphatase ApaH/serine/threonine PP2A family protein phosphatase
MLCAFPGGPEILRTLLSEGVPVVRGNADDLMLGWSRAQPHSRLRASPQFLPVQASCVRFSESDFEAISAWPLTREVVDPESGARILLCHGTPRSNSHSIADYALEPARSHLEGLEAQAVVAGHYHFHWQRRVNGRLLALSGSCGKPIAGGVRAQYLTVDVDKGQIFAEHRAVEYDREAFFADLRQHEFTKQAGPIGWLELSELLLARVIMLRYIRRVLDSARASDLDYLAWSVRHYLAERGILSLLESTFGELR